MRLIVFLATVIVFIGVHAEDSVSDFRTNYLDQCKRGSVNWKGVQICECAWDSWEAKLDSKTSEQALNAASLLANPLRGHVGDDYATTPILASFANSKSMCIDKLGPETLKGPLVLKHNHDSVPERVTLSTVDR